MEFIKETKRFYHNDESGKLLAEITWEERDNVLYVNHTFTDPSLRGQGIAALLVDQVAQYAREEGYKVMPVCSYVVHKFDNDSQYADLDIR